MVSFSNTTVALFTLIAAALTGRSEADAGGNLRHDTRNLATTYWTTSQYSSLMLAELNAQRAAQGLPRLCINTKLMAAATRHSSDMATQNFMSHTGSDGSTMAGRVTTAGYTWNRVAENVAAGQVNVAAVMISWMKSTGHRANILGDYKQVGFAYAYSSTSTYKHYWTQNFAKSTTESCSYEDTEYNENDTPQQNTTTEVPDNSTIAIPDLPAAVNASRVD